MIHTHKTLSIIISALIIGAVVFAAYPSAHALMQYIRATNGETPMINSGKEVIYSFMNKGDVRVADQLLLNSYEISRFTPVAIPEVTWREDPFSDIYWRFNFYNLEPVRNLLYAWELTGNTAYKDKMIELTESFVDHGMDGPYSWDLHGAAFRTMTLVNLSEKLDRRGELPPELKEKINNALEVHGRFLADPTHFEEDYNHGLDQSAALYLLAVNFPGLSDANLWRTLAEERITGLIKNIVNEDGVLVENSPYYHFYVLEKLWDIHDYVSTYKLPEFSGLESMIDKMLTYGAYILQPDGSIPLIGASVERTINHSGIYRDMGAKNPALLYALTKGEEGREPASLNIRYPINGQTIMRSQWGVGEEFLKQTQLVFDVGNFRTNHSDLDALSFNLFGDGISLMPDAGLYEYELGPYRTYFQGTRAHNTVVVDGKDQAAGEKLEGSIEKVFASIFEEGDGYVYQSASHALYQGVAHQRAIMMIEDSTVLVFDNLTSDKEHTYEQMFHLNPGAEVEIDGLTVRAHWNGGAQQVAITQLVTDGVEVNAVLDQQDPLDGVCSTTYKTIVPCHAIAYSQKGQENATYITAISIGGEAPAVHFDWESKTVRVETERGVYVVRPNEVPGSDRSIDVQKKYSVAQSLATLVPVPALNEYAGWTPVSAATMGMVGASSAGDAINISLPAGSTYFEAEKPVQMDLTNKVLYFKARVDGEDNLDSMRIEVSNNNWEKSATYDLRSGVYGISNIHRNRQWFQYSLGQGEVRTEAFGNWRKSDPSFDWSAIDEVRLLVESKNGNPVSVEFKDFALNTNTEEARAVVVFDDGWSSVWDAAALMHKYGFKGNVPIITGYVGHDNYLTLEQLKSLQNDYDWNIVNHTHTHKNATLEYVYKNELDRYESDVTEALEYMIRNGINSAPNWFVYPHGKTDIATKAVVNKYYKYGRSTMDGPEFFPYAEPLETKILSVYSDETTQSDVFRAIDDAKKYNQTLMLMFHKFSVGRPTLFTEWQLSEFEEILKYLKSSGIQVLTYSELDQANQVPPTEFGLQEYAPAHYDLEVSVESKSFLQRILSILR